MTVNLNLCSLFVKLVSISSEISRLRMILQTHITIYRIENFLVSTSSLEVSFVVSKSS